VSAFVIGAALAQASAPASAKPVSVTIQGQAFAPTTIDALPNDRVTWSNTSDQTHTVTADNGLFDSGYLSAARTFSYTFTTPGTYAYHCIIHRGMVGEIDVREVTLDPLPPAAVAAKSNVSFSGRTADTSTPVAIQMQTAQGFHTVATASPHADGSWGATLTATKTARYRAQSNGSTSEIRRLLVINRTVKVRVTRRGVAVTVAPSTPYGLVALQYRLRDRFGWWIVARKRLDYVSTTTFGIHRRAMVFARVVLLGPDHWTPVATSRVVRVRPHK
jgi:plastocyanin